MRSRDLNRRCPRNGDRVKLQPPAADGHLDLLLKFRMQDTIEALALPVIAPGNDRELVIRGTFVDGYPFVGRDRVRPTPTPASEEKPLRCVSTKRRDAGQ